MMIPAFWKMIPIAYRDETNPAYTALRDRVQEIHDDMQDDISVFGNIRNPERCPAVGLDAFGEELQAGILPFDSTLTKRKKIDTAVKSHKTRFSFVYDAKPKIDAICGGDCYIVPNILDGDWIMMGDGTNEAEFWGTMGDGTDEQIGLYLSSGVSELGVGGNIFIDVDNPGLTAQEISNLTVTVKDIVPVYYIVHLAYIDPVLGLTDYVVIGA